MIKKFLILISFILLLFASTQFAFAKKALPKAQATSSKKPVGVSTSKGVTTKVQFRGDRRAVVATFTNLGIASSVSYTLTYDTNGTTQGAGGSILPGAPEPISRELLFGSCSHGICRYDSKITNAKLIVTTNLKNGRKVVKTFKLKV